MDISQKQVTQIASNILVSDITSYISSHLQEYEVYLNEEYRNENITKTEFDYEIELIKRIKLEGFSYG